MLGDYQIEQSVWIIKWFSNYTCRETDSDKTCFSGEGDSSVEVSSSGRSGNKENMDDWHDRDSDMGTGLFSTGLGAGVDAGTEKRMTW